MVKIGVILDSEEKITSLEDATKVAIYESDASTWKKTDEIEKCFQQRESMSQMREFLSQFMIELEDCNILIASILTGIPFMMLDKAGYMLCEADKLSDQLFEEIESDYEKMKQKKEESHKITKINYPTAPYETCIKDVYEFDLIKLFDSHPEISSKMAIIPFLKQVKFTQLIIYCSHVMPWLDKELPSLGFCYQVNRIEEQGYRVEIKEIHS